MKVIICGGRDYHLTDEDRATLTALHKTWHFSLVLTGAATGADLDGELWAAGAGLLVQRFPAQWEIHGRAAGPRRNKAMVDYCAAGTPGIVVAFPGGRGTRNCLVLAKQAGLRIIQSGLPHHTPAPQGQEAL